MRKRFLSFVLAFGAITIFANPHAWAQNTPAQSTETDAISATLNKATGKQAENSEPKQDTAALPDNGDLPPMPTDKESLKTLTNALAADKSAIEEKDRQRKAFENALNNTFPLSPDQIKEVMRRMTEAQEAGKSPPAPEPKPTVKVENVSLDPGVTPPLIAVSTGYVTTVNLLDITGAPWPIQDVVVGGNFQITGPNDSNVLRIIPQTRFGKGNLSIRLVGLSTAVTFRVESGGPEVYYRYDARIPQTGPAAKQALIDRGYSGEAGSGLLLAILDGTPPEGSKKMVIAGTDGRTRAYKIDEAVYLRTPLTLLSPGWDASVRSADGTNVYRLTETPVMMLSDNGQMIRAKMTAPPEDAFHTNDLKDGKISVPVNSNGSVASAGDKPVSVPPATAPQPEVAPPVVEAQQPAPSATPARRRQNGGVQVYTNGYSQDYPPQNFNNTRKSNGGTP